MFQCRERSGEKEIERQKKPPLPTFFCVVRSPPPLSSQTLFPLLRQKALQGQAAKAKQAAGAKAQKKGKEVQERFLCGNQGCIRKGNIYKGAFLLSCRTKNGRTDAWALLQRLLHWAKKAVWWLRNEDKGRKQFLLYLH